MVIVYGQHHGDAIFEDDNGLASIPLRVLPVVHHSADVADSGYVTYDGRRYHRDTLAAVRRDHEADALAELDTCRWSNQWFACERPILAGTSTRCAYHDKD